MTRSFHSAPPAFEVCILAGGLSSRMGRDKSRLRIGRRSMLGHVRATAEGLGCRVRVIRRDLVPRCGPLGGILTGLISAKADAVVFLSCDMPFVTPELLRELITRLGPNQSASGSRGVRIPGVRGAFARSGATVGFPLVVRREVRGDLERLIAEKTLSLQEFARRTKAKSVRVTATRARELINLNTPEDLELAVKTGSKQGKVRRGESESKNTSRI